MRTWITLPEAERKRERETPLEERQGRRELLKQRRGRLQSRTDICYFTGNRSRILQKVPPMQTDVEDERCGAWARWTWLLWEMGQPSMSWPLTQTEDECVHLHETVRQYIHWVWLDLLLFLCVFFCLCLCFLMIIHDSPFFFYVWITWPTFWFYRSFCMYCNLCTLQETVTCSVIN